MSEPRADPGPEPASRRTYLAEERTLLAWWRTGVAAAAVAVGVGGVVPKVSGLPRERFLVLAAGYGAVALVFVIGGTVRVRASERALAEGGFAPVPAKFLIAMTVVIAVLVVLTVLSTF